MNVVDVFLLMIVVVDVVFFCILKYLIEVKLVGLILFIVLKMFMNYIC